MGQDISSIAYNEDLFDIKVTGLSCKQVEMISRSFECLASKTRTQEYFFTSKNLAGLLKIPLKEATSIIKFADLDGDGRLSSYEFICLVGLFTQEDPQEKVEALFSLFDEDGSQFISEEELTSIVRCVISVNENGTEPSKAQVDTKLTEIKTVQFTQEVEMRLLDFCRFCFEDPDFRNALVKVGVFRENDCEAFYNDDIDQEINRFEDDEQQPQVDEMGNIIAENDAGDEFMAIRPYLGVVKNSVPSNFDPKKADLSLPDMSLELEYVHGYRCFDTRNNVFWNGKDSMIFHTAAVGVVMDLKNNTQKFNFNNTDDILSIAKHGSTIATGQIGHKPVINLWNVEDFENSEIIVGDLQKGISHLDISKNGSLLAGVAMNDDHDIAIYNIENRLAPKLFSKSKGVKDAVLHLRFARTANNNKLFLATNKEIYEGEFNKSGIKVKKVSGWGSRDRQPCLAIGFLKGTDCVVGLMRGELAVVRGRTISKFLKAHAGSIFATTSNEAEDRLFTGGADGKIMIWSEGMNKIGEINIMEENLNIYAPKIRAIAFNEETNKMIVGTRSGCIAEVDINNRKQGRVLLRGHFDKELWGLSLHPTRQEFVTSGEDFLLAKWNLPLKSQLQSVQLKYQSKTLSISGDHIAVGCNNGILLIFDYSSLKQLKELKSSKKEISVLKYCPYKKYLAVGAHDSLISVYDVERNYKMICKLKGHHSTITHLDFSESGEALQSTCTSMELLYWELPSGKQNTKGASGNRDEKWATWTCTIGWHVQGVYPPYADGTDVNMTARSKNGTVLASADDFGQVKLFRYPCLPKTQFSTYHGHSSHVTNVEFSADDRFVISTGGNDKTIFQWKVLGNEGNEAVEYEDDGEFDEKQIRTQTSGTENGFVEAEEDEGDEFMAIKPWKGDLQASIPSDYQYIKGMEEAPISNLQLSYVQGYRCFEARETAYLNSSGKSVVFVTASLGVELDLATNTQTFFQKHDNDVISFALHPSREIAATGQMAQKGKSKCIDIFVWNIKDKTPLAHFNTFHLRAIQCLKFSPSGSKLLSYGQDDDNSLAIFDWGKGLLLATAKVDKTNVLDSEFISESKFYSCGTRHLKSWNFNGNGAVGSNVSWKVLRNKAQAVVSITNDDKQNLLGTTSNGTLLLVRGSAITAFKKDVHKGPIYVTQFSEKTKTFLTGGKDGIVNEISIQGSSLVHVRTVIKITEQDSLNFAIKVLDAHSDVLLVGTSGNDLFTFNNVEQPTNKKRILSGHYGQELWGLACHPTSQVYATCGDDKAVKTWNINSRNLINSIDAGVKLRAIDYSKCGNFLVCASMCGKIIIFTSDLKNEIQRAQTRFNSANQWIEEIKFSPNNQYIAFGAHGGVSPVVIYSFDGKNLKLYGSIKAGTTSALLHLDWSTDSNNIVLNSQAYELKFIDVNSKSQIYAKSMKDTEWDTWTCKIGFPVQGIFPGVMGSEVNSTCRSGNKNIIATGENSQLVKIFKYPCTIEKAQFKSYLAHASFVTRVRFTQGDNHLVSAGGHDNTTMIWKTDFGSDNKEQDIEVMDDEDENECCIQKKVAKDKYLREPEPVFESEKMEGDFQMEDADEENEFMAIKPWLGAIKAPTDPKANAFKNEPPVTAAELEYVYGFRSKDCRNNIFVNADKIFYNAAALAVCLDPKSNNQKFFKEHRDDVISIAYCPQKKIFATGEIGPKPRLFVWNEKDMSLVTRLEGGIIKGIASLAFSPSGAFLAATCIDDNHHVALFDIQKGALISCEKGDTANILDCEFISENEFVTVGMRHFKSWKAEAPLKGSRGSFGKFSDKILCCKKFKSSALVGSVTGDLQIWNGKSCSRAIKVHKGRLDAIHVANNTVLTGGKDCKVNILDGNLNLISCIDLNRELTEGCCNQVRALTLSENERELYIGTYASEIYLLICNVKFTSSQIEKPSAQRLMTGHFARNLKWTNEIWGLCTLKDTRFMTVSDDGTLRMWSAAEKTQELILNLNIDKNGVPLERDKTTGDLVPAAKLRSVAACQEDKHAAVGCMDGTIRIIDIEKWEQIKIIKNRKRWISEIRYSPNNEFLAVGSHDCFIDIYRVNSNYKKTFSMKKHSSFITHLDWSEDSNYLHSNCGAHELLFWDANSGMQLTSGASALRDEAWATWSCVLGWPVQGIFKEEWDGTDINMADRSKTKTSEGFHVLATADDFGTLRLYNYPCIQKNSKGVILRGHSSHVTNVKFDQDDERLFSTGGEDQTVMQWKLNMQ